MAADDTRATVVLRVHGCCVLILEGTFSTRCNEHGSQTCVNLKGIRNFEVPTRSSEPKEGCFRSSRPYFHVSLKLPRSKLLTVAVPNQSQPGHLTLCTRQDAHNVVEHTHHYLPFDMSCFACFVNLPQI